jgi:adenylate cyclase
MTLLDDIRKNVADYLQGDYEVTDAKTIPSVEDVPFGKQAKKMKLCVFYIDLRHSTNLLFLHDKQTAGKIHKSFLHAVSSVVRSFDGYIRSFNGDSLLAFWPAFYKSQITSCVRSAMTVKWLLDVELSPLFEKYEKLDFGIGVDWGEVFIARAGLPRDSNNNDLIFMGRCVNFAVAIGEQARGPSHVEISTDTYANLEDPAIYGDQGGSKVDMWRPGIVKWQGIDYKTKLTSWHWKL